jgi:hypothetical protein
MAERSLKKRANGRMMQLQKLCGEVGINLWKMKFHKTVGGPGKPIDMFVVRDGANSQVISIGMIHGDDKAAQFFEELFKQIIPALAGSILLLDLYDTLVKLEKYWSNLELRDDVMVAVDIIRNSVDRMDRPTPDGLRN